MLMIGRPPGAYDRHKEDPWMSCFNVEIDDTVSNCQVENSEPDAGYPGSNENGVLRQLMERDYSV